MQSFQRDFFDLGCKSLVPDYAITSPDQANNDTVLTSPRNRNRAWEFPRIEELMQIATNYYSKIDFEPAEPYLVAVELTKTEPYIRLLGLMLDNNAELDQVLERALAICYSAETGNPVAQSFISRYLQMTLERGPINSMKREPLDYDDLVSAPLVVALKALETEFGDSAPTRIGRIFGAGQALPADNESIIAKAAQTIKDENSALRLINRSYNALLASKRWGRPTLLTMVREALKDLMD